MSRHRALLPVVGAHACLMVAWAILRHRNFGSHAYDLGAYHSVFWNLAHTQVPFNAVEGMHQWSAHLELGLVPLGLAYRVWDSPVWLFLLQNVAVAASALPLDAMARRAGGSSRLGLGVAVAFLLTPQLLFAQIYDFHSITVAVLPVALLCWALHRDSVAGVWLAAALALSLREQMGLAVLMAGVAWPLVHGRRRGWMGASLGAVGLGMFLAQVLWLIPAFGDGSGFQYAGHYGRLGGGPSEALAFALRHPLSFLALPFEGARPRFVLKLLAGATPLLLVGAWRFRRTLWPLLPALPLLAVQLYADREEVWNVRFHYGAPVVPLVAAAAALAAAALYRTRPRLAWVALGTWMAVNGAFTALRVGPYAVEPGGPLDPPSAERREALAEAFSRIPPDACVSAQDQLVPHLASRRCIHQWPAGEGEDRFIVLDRNTQPHNHPPEPVDQAMARLRGDERFRILLDRAGVLLVERRGGPND